MGVGVAAFIVYCIYLMIWKDVAGGNCCLYVCVVHISLLMYIFHVLGHNIYICIIHIIMIKTMY